MKVSEHVEKLLRQGRKPKELVELGFPKAVVTKVHKRLRKEKAALKEKVSEGTAEQESQLQIPAEWPEEIVLLWRKLQSMANDIEKLDGLTKVLSEVTVLVAAAREIGTNRREACPDEKDGLCVVKTWSSKDEIPQGIGEPVAAGNEESGWYIKPSPFYCAMCTTNLEYRIADVEDQESYNPLSGARYKITCKDCGSTGWIAVAIKCTECGRETYWGWHPKKE